MANTMVHNATGVELRFVIHGESATVRMSTADNDPNSFCTFHVYRGGIQGGWDDHELHCHVTGAVEDFVIKASPNAERLRQMSERIGCAWDPTVVRVIFDRGAFKIYDVMGDVTPPTSEQCPPKTLLTYGSSITHGSNSIDASHTWPSVVAHNLNVDVRNLGMAGSCCLEPAMADYIAAEGERGAWDLAVLELGINVLGWEDSKILERTEDMLRTVVGRNPDKPVFVISPFYHCGDDFNPNDRAKVWRRLIEQTVEKLQYPNLTYICGMDLIGDVSSMSADEIHPNIYGVQRIADGLTARIRQTLGKDTL